MVSQTTFSAVELFLQINQGYVTAYVIIYDQ